MDPSNRLVADSLEADWNERPRALAETKERYEQQKLADQTMAKQIDRERAMSLVQVAEHGEGWGVPARWE